MKIIKKKPNISESICTHSYCPLLKYNRRLSHLYTQDTLSDNPIDKEPVRATFIFQSESVSELFF